MTILVLLMLIYDTYLLLKVLSVVRDIKNGL